MGSEVKSGVLSLAQVNKQLRGEFRPLWLRYTTQKIRLDDYVVFLRDFWLYPKRGPLYPGITSDNLPVGKLIISLDSAWRHMDILRLLRFKAQVPDYIIEFSVDRSKFDVQDQFHVPNALQELQALLVHSNEHWVTAIKRRRFDQVILKKSGRGYGQVLTVIFIVKSLYAEDWMCALVGNRIQRFRTLMGMDGFQNLAVDLGIAY